MDREDAWEKLILAEANRLYWTRIIDIIQVFDFGVRAVLLVSSVVSLISIFARPGFEVYSVSISALAAIFEVIIKPLIKLEEALAKAKEWRKEWVQLSSQLDTIWRGRFLDNPDAREDCSKIRRKIDALDCDDFNLLFDQRIFDYCWRKVLRARGIEI